MFPKWQPDSVYYSAISKQECREQGNVHISTDDGSEGYKGFITELLKENLPEWKGKDIAFYNCGPPAMIKVANEIQKEYSDKIYNSIDYVTKCGVGICGSCATKDGRRSCVDGPFLKW